MPVEAIRRQQGEDQVESLVGVNAGHSRFDVGQVHVEYYGPRRSSDRGARRGSAHRRLVRLVTATQTPNRRADSATLTHRALVHGGRVGYLDAVADANLAEPSGKFDDDMQ